MTRRFFGKSLIWFFFASTRVLADEDLTRNGKIRVSDVKGNSALLSFSVQIELDEDGEANAFVWSSEVIENKGLNLGSVKNLRLAKEGFMACWCVTRTNAKKDITLAFLKDRDYESLSAVRFFREQGYITELVEFEQAPTNFVPSLEAKQDAVLVKRGIMRLRDDEGRQAVIEFLLEVLGKDFKTSEQGIWNEKVLLQDDGFNRKTSADLLLSKEEMACDCLRLEGGQISIDFLEDGEVERIWTGGSHELTYWGEF